MAKPYAKLKVKGVGTPKQIRSVTSATIPGFEFGLKLSGIDAADILTGIEEGVQNANQIIASRLGEALDEAMSSAVWSWDDGTRDIVDTGKLMSSRNVTVDGNRISISYDVPYAGLVHYGGYIVPYGNKSVEKVYIPARPWVDSVVMGGGPVPQFNFEEIYAQAIERAFP